MNYHSMVGPVDGNTTSVRIEPRLLSIITKGVESQVHHVKKNKTTANKQKTNKTGDRRRRNSVSISRKTGRTKAVGWSRQGTLALSYQ